MEPCCRTWITRERPWYLCLFPHFLFSICFLSVDTMWLASLSLLPLHSIVLAFLLHRNGLTPSECNLTQSLFSLHCFWSGIWLEQRKKYDSQIYKDGEYNGKKMRCSGNRGTGSFYFMITEFLSGRTENSKDECEWETDGNINYLHHKMIDIVNCISILLY